MPHNPRILWRPSYLQVLASSSSGPDFLTTVLVLLYYCTTVLLPRFQYRDELAFSMAVLEPRRLRN